MKTQQEADEDRQLAMYALWVKKNFKDAITVTLKWHMLAFSKDVESKRSDKELEELEKSVIKLIKEIETTKEYPTNVTALCNYCEYQNICPSMKHKNQLEQKNLKDFKNDDGVKLVTN
jgi:CRISPR/Cas system-associated exonuclease Cas4 (RecB family)